MSRYESERGTFILPGRHLSRIKAHLADMWNRNEQKRFDMSVLFREQLTAAAASDTAPSWHILAEPLWETFKAAHRLTDEEAGDVWQSVVPWQDPGEAALPPLPPVVRQPDVDASSPMLELDNGSYSVVFNDILLTITWDVPDNNHACSAARQSALGAALFASLAAIDWPAATGGCVVGQDEYSQEHDQDGWFDKDGFGPLGGGQPTLRAGLSDEETIAALGPRRF